MTDGPSLGFQLQLCLQRPSHMTTLSQGPEHPSAARCLYLFSRQIFYFLQPATSSFGQRFKCAADLHSSFLRGLGRCDGVFICIEKQHSHDKLRGIDWMLLVKSAIPFLFVFFYFCFQRSVAFTQSVHAACWLSAPSHWSSPPLSDGGADTVKFMREGNNLEAIALEMSAAHVSCAHRKIKACVMQTLETRAAWHRTSQSM